MDKDVGNINVTETETGYCNKMENDTSLIRSFFDHINWVTSNNNYKNIREKVFKLKKKTNDEIVSILTDKSMYENSIFYKKYRDIFIGDYLKLFKKIDHSVNDFYIAFVDGKHDLNTCPMFKMTECRYLNKVIFGNIYRHFKKIDISAIEVIHHEGFYIMIITITKDILNIRYYNGVTCYNNIIDVYNGENIRRCMKNRHIIANKKYVADNNIVCNTHELLSNIEPSLGDNLYVYAIEKYGDYRERGFNCLYFNRNYKISLKLFDPMFLTLTDAIRFGYLKNCKFYTISLDGILCDIDAQSNSEDLKIIEMIRKGKFGDKNVGGFYKFNKIYN